MTEPDLALDRPEERSEPDGTLVARGVTGTPSVEEGGTSVVGVRPAGEGSAWKQAVKPGAAVELYWVGGHEEGALPARISEVEEGIDPRWHLAVAGTAERSQRRKAVRARVQLPVLMPWAGGQMTGETVDVSEAGM